MPLENNLLEDFTEKFRRALI